MDIKRKMVFTGSLLMFLAIILGAMASHYLERIISPESILSFEVGVRYMVYHALALLVFSGKEFYLEQSKRIVFRMFTYGTLLFSGSIFLLSFKALFRFSISWLGPITPIGGGLLILGWGLSAWSFFKKL
jgi:uncharacterized membrane protein YgdD (TMEM256/DUF423 family)